ncbi:alanine racemase [Mycoplasma sp. P36-A1]|uniref:alanine racemase n=1 Tax=Mycoplasma sp. P36-A1 TaxID=3252900 RepID=UPI003C2EDD57
MNIRKNMSNYYRNSIVKINVDNVLYNLNKIKETCSKDKMLFAVIKGNAYGHGLIEMAKIVKESNVDALAVATTDEALAIRTHQKGMKILNLGITRDSDYSVAAKNYITVTVANLDNVKTLESLDLVQSLKVHLKINTGMNRIGFYDIDSTLEAIKRLSKNKMIKIEGIYTHFATAEDYDKEDYLWQQYNKFASIVKESKIKYEYIHCSNSASLLKFADKFTITTANRVGIAMYNALEDIAIKKYELKDTLEITSRITQVMKYPVGSKIGYSNNYTTETDYEYIATLPIGYADGIQRHLTKSIVLCNGVEGIIVGSICMDQMMVKFPVKVNINDEIVILGSDTRINVYSRAKHLNTITHEVLTNLGPRLARVYYKNNEVIQISNDMLKL